MNIDIKTYRKYILELTEEEMKAFQKEQYNRELNSMPVTKAIIRLLENQERKEPHAYDYNVPRDEL